MMNVFKFMKKVYKSNIILCLLFTLAGCYSDKGNYEYVDINRVNLYLNCGSSCVITRGETLNIKAQISFPDAADGKGDSDRLIFNWYLGGYSANEAEREKYLLKGEEWQSSEVSWTPDRLMTNESLLVEVYDPVTEIRYFAGTKVTVKSEYDAWGVLVLSEKENGKSMFSYIKWKPEDLKDLNSAEVMANITRSGNVMTSYTEYPDVFYNDYGTDLPAGPISLSEHYNADKTSVANVLVLTENGAIDLSGRDFSIDPIESLEKQFTGGSYPAGMNYISEAEMMTRVDLVTDQDGHIYTRIRNTNKLFHSGNFLNSRLSLNGEEVSGAHLYMHPHSTSPNACIVHDDNRNRLFAVLDSGASVEFDLQETDIAAGHSFPINDASVPTSADGSENMYLKASDLSAAEKIFHVGFSVDAAHRTSYQSTFVVFKRGRRYFLEELWISRVALGRGNFEFNVTKSRIEEIKGLPGDPVDMYISPYTYVSTTEGEAPMGLNPYMMIAVGNQIYVYSMDPSLRTNPVIPYFNAPLRANVVDVDGDALYGKWWLAAGLDDGSVIVINMRTPSYSPNRVVFYDSKKEMYNATTSAGLPQESDKTPLNLGKVKSVCLKRGGTGGGNAEIWSVATID